MMTIDELIGALEYQKKMGRGSFPVAAFRDGRVLPISGTGTMRKAYWDGETSHDLFILFEKEWDR